MNCLVVQSQQDWYHLLFAMYIMHQFISWFYNHTLSVIMEYTNEGQDQFWFKCLFKQVTWQHHQCCRLCKFREMCLQAISVQPSMTCYWPFAFFFWRERNLHIKGSWNNNSMAVSWLFQWCKVNSRVYEPDKCAFMQNREKATFALKYNF